MENPTTAVLTTCNACHVIATGVATTRDGRLVAVDAPTIRERGALVHRDCHGIFVTPVEEVVADA